MFLTGLFSLFAIVGGWLARLMEKGGKRET
jgi:hypothetical protein